MTSNINGYFRQAKVTFPIAFSSAPTVVANILAGWGNSATETRATCKVVAASTTGATIYVGDSGGQLANINAVIAYIAIGK